MASHKREMALFDVIREVTINTKNYLINQYQPAKSM